MVAIDDMANQEHLNILGLALREGSIKIWEEWRSNNPQIKPDLSGENLKGLFLQEINFKETDLIDILPPLNSVSCSGGFQPRG